MYIANECFLAKVISLDYDGGGSVTQILDYNYIGSISAVDDDIFVSTNDGTTNATAYMEVRAQCRGRIDMRNSWNTGNLVDSVGWHSVRSAQGG
jgi:hypothetical protein